MIWRTKHHALDVSTGKILMGIINLTPDSFSDGGSLPTPALALQHATKLVQDGATILDIGGESTRPGAAPISPEQEQARVLPSIRAIRNHFPPASGVLLSLDTRHPATAQAGLELGIDIINDISGLADPTMVQLAVQHACGVVIMHKLGDPKTMQIDPFYDDVCQTVRAFFAERFRTLTHAGISPLALCFDPGIGFGKTTAHNLALITQLASLRVHDRPLLMALSRKRFLATIFSQQEARSPLPTAAFSVLSHLNGANIHRVHDVQACRNALMNKKM